MTESIPLEKLNLSSIENNDLIILRLENAATRTNETIKEIYSKIQEAIGEKKIYLLVLDKNDEIEKIPAFVWQKFAQESKISDAPET